MDLKSNDSNNFDFIRLLAAIMVLFSHSFGLSGYSNIEPLLNKSSNISFGGLGVFIFFIISGYLISKSWDTKPIIVRYFWNRILRIFPGLAVVVLFTVLFIGPLNTNLPILDYFYNKSVYAYLLIITIFPLMRSDLFNLPGVFINNVDSGTINGSLWTIPYEFLMYIGLFVIGIMGLLKNRLFILILSLFLLCSWIILGYMFNNILFYFYISNILSFGFYFSIGIIYYIYRDKIRFDYKIAIIALAIFILSLERGVLINNIAQYICIPYIVFTFAFLPIHFNNIGKHGDFSYGIYIYGFPIQQTIAHFLGTTNPMLFFVISFICVVPLAILSWYFIESRALSLKRIDPIKLFKEKISK